MKNIWMQYALVAGTMFSAVAAWAGPELLCPEPVYDFGKMESSEVVECAFVLYNVGDETLEIGSIETSCGCTVAEVEHRQLAPGGETVLWTKLDLENRSGEQEKPIFVESNDSAYPRTVLVLKGEVVEPVAVVPGALYQLVEAGAIKRKFTVSSIEEGPLELGPVVNDGDSRVEVRVVGGSSDKQKTVVISTHMKPGARPIAGKLEIQTNSKRIPLLEVRYRFSEKRQRQVAKKKENPATLFRGIDLSRIDGLEITQGPHTLSLAKQEGQWVVGSFFNYPVDSRKLYAALHAVSEVKLGRPVRASNLASSEYGLDAAKTIVLKTGGKHVARLEVGTGRKGSDVDGREKEYFVRKVGAEAIHLVDYDFYPFSERFADWINTELINVDASEVVSVKVGDVEMKMDGKHWKLVDLDEETEELKSWGPNRLRFALQEIYCRMVVNPNKTDAELGFTNAVSYTAQTTHKTYTVTIGGAAHRGRYIRLSGDVPERLNGWTYVISDNEAANFLVTREELVKEKEAPAQEKSLVHGKDCNGI